MITESIGRKSYHLNSSSSSKMNLAKHTILHWPHDTHTNTRIYIYIYTHTLN